MKPKTKRLAEQAGFVLWGDEEWKPQGAVVDWSCIYDVELEKFAELIVRECAEIFEKVYTDQHRPERIDTRIKQHFGVE